MVIVQLYGGLGNQLFQYALGRRVSERNKVPLKLDLSAFETYKLHKYSLFNFDICENIATAKDLKKIKQLRSGAGLFCKISRFKERMAPNMLKYHIIQKNVGFEPHVMNMGGEIYLEGYWQSEKYFKDIEEIVRKEFFIKTVPSEENKKIGSQIAGSDSISIHVRRSDYVNDSRTNNVHGACSIEYYKAAIAKITQGIKKPVFYVFSDDHEWTRKELKINYPAVYVENNNAEKNYEDLRLMSLCKHNIIANSSFSWWGAWLNENPDKVVIAPAEWFNSKVIKYDIGDIVPQSWIKM